MGTAMMDRAYTQWHGFYEVAKTFYTEFIPGAEALLPGVTADVINSPYHQWTKGLSKEQLQQRSIFLRRSTTSEEYQSPTRRVMAIRQGK